MEQGQPDTKRRDRVLETARQELLKFERQENEFRKRDREERAAELKIPFGDSPNVRS